MARQVTFKLSDAQDKYWEYLKELVGATDDDIFEAMALNFASESPHTQRQFVAFTHESKLAGILFLFQGDLGLDFPCKMCGLTTLFSLLGMDEDEEKNSHDVIN
jgi:hypothetical protein